MHITIVREVGISMMLEIPLEVIDLLGWKAGSTARMTVDGGSLIVQSIPKPRYSIDDLLAQCNPAESSADEDAAWLNAVPVGREL